MQLDSTLPSQASQDDILPPLSNKGGPQTDLGTKQVSFRPDWISCTYPIPITAIHPDNGIIGSLEKRGPFQLFCQQCIGPLDDILWDERGSSHRGYLMSHRLASGGSMAYHPTVIRQGLLVQWTGQSLTALLAERGPDDIMRQLQALGGRTARLDVAIDLFLTERPDIKGLQDKVTTRLGFSGGNYSMVDGPDGEYEAHTVYFGSSQSDRWCRIYDKSAERKDWSEGYWLRIELVLKGDYARAFVDNAAQTAFAPAARGELQSMFASIDAEWWETVLSGEVVEHQSLGRHAGADRRAWLLSLLPLYEDMLWQDAVAGRSDLREALAGLVHRAPVGKQQAREFVRKGVQDE